MLDLVFQGGRVISGSGDPWYYGDVGVKNDSIFKVDRVKEKAHRVIDASGMYICPGFIDMHSHSDLVLLADPALEPKVRQGVTTELLGQDGLSYAPLSPSNLQMMRRYLVALNGNPEFDQDWSSVREYLDCFNRRVAPNVAYLLPHNALRLETVGFVDRQASSGEMEKMQEMVVRGMDEGAVGVSFGLDYCPGRYSDTRELVAICQAAARRGGVSVWHTRRRDSGLLASLEEVFHVAEKTGIKTHISHLATNYPANKEKPGEILFLIDKYREKALDITFDSYPYIASQTSLIIIFPGWVHDGGPDAMLERLQDPATKRKICTELHASSIAWDKLMIAGVGKKENEKFVGQSLAGAAKMASKDPAEFACDLFFEEQLNVGYIGMEGREENVQMIMQHPAHMVGSDAVLVGQRPNPRSFGAFPRFLARYCREEKLLRLEEMVRHMSSAPAQCLGLHDRGLIKPGMKADLVVFDPAAVKDTATFENPKRFPQGIKYVTVNGQLVIDNEAHTGAFPGRVLYRK